MNESRAIFRRSLRQSGALLVAALVPALLAAAWHPRRPAWSLAAAAAPEVTWGQVLAWAKPALLIDARPTPAYEQRHIPGALPLSEPQWEAGLPAIVRAWRPGTRVVVYCDDAGCGASQEVARRLRRELGIDEVFVLKGGWGAWLRAQQS